MSAFAQWLLGTLSAFIEWLFNLGIDLIQLVSDSLADFAVSILSLFPSGTAIPSMPSTPSGTAFTVFIQCLNWLFPVAFLVQLSTWVAAGMIAYLVIAPLARWAKLLN